MSLSRAELKALWLTGYKPTQQDFADFFDAFFNLHDDTITNSMITSITVDKISDLLTITRFTGAWTTQTLAHVHELTYVVASATATVKTINLDPSPTPGQKAIIKDGLGNFSTYNVTVQGNGNPIENDTSCLLAIDRMAVCFQWDGTAWIII